MNSKQERYKELVEEFKDFKGFPIGIYNPFDLPTDFPKYDKINAWELWHSDLNAETMIIGQDSTSKDKFIEIFTNGKEKNKLPDGTENKLHNLYNSLDRGNIGLFHKKAEKLPLFLTNAVWGIKDGKKSKGVKSKWYECTSHLLRKLIEIIEPCNIICLGMVPYNAIQHIYPSVKKFKLSGESIDYNGQYDEITMGNKKSNLFVVAHPSVRRVNRTYKQQQEDWLKLKKLMVSSC